MSFPSTASRPPVSSRLPVAATGRPKADASTMSLVNIAARQRMLSQRMVMQTLLASQGHLDRLPAARSSLALFTESQTLLQATVQQLDAASTDAVRNVYDGPQGVAPTIRAFMKAVDRTLECLEAGSPRAAEALAAVVGQVDEVLAALDAATKAIDQYMRTRGDLLQRELTDIVNSIRGIAREATVVSFNAQVIAARAGDNGREFAVVAKVLSGIAGQVDQLSRQAVALADKQGTAR